jgi:uncharacterized phage protein (TIGR01671 family)
MREILFRGKRVDNGEWVEGTVAYINSEYLDRKVTIIIPINATELLHEGIIYSEVQPETVCQHTGLKDRNGTKIFEGDILKGFQYPYLSDGEYNYYAEVCWFDNCPAFGLYTFKAPDAKVRGISEGNTDIIEDFASEDWEVIGNIHDNKELLREE